MNSLPLQALFLGQTAPLLGRLRRGLAVVAGVAALVPLAGLAQTITFTGAAVNSGGGYTAGQSYTFSFNVSESVWNSTPSSFLANDYANFSDWSASDITVAGGSAWVGSAEARSGGFGTFYFSNNWYFAPGGLDAGSLTGPEGQKITYFSATVPDLGGLGALSVEPASFGTYAAAFAGSYSSPWSDVSYLSLGWEGDRFVEFTVSSVAVTSASSAVPEPSTYAAIAGAMGLGVVLVARRRRQATRSA